MAELADSRAPELEEHRLVERLLWLQGGADPPLPAADRKQAWQAWHAECLAFLQAHGGQHWWCQHADVTAGLAEVLRYHEQQPLVQSIWLRLSEQLGACSDCVNLHHAAQERYAEQFQADTAAPLLAALRSLDRTRVAAALMAAERQAAVEGSDAGQLPPEVITPLFEALTYDSLLEDAEVADALAATLCTLSARYELALAEPGSEARYGGAYRLLAHPDPAPRRLAAAAVRAWGSFADAAAAEVVLPTLQSWVQLLAAQPHDAPAAQPARPSFRPPPLALWRALHGLLPLLAPEAAAAVLPHLPQLADAVLSGMFGGSATAGSASLLELDTCRWFAMSCWSQLLSAVGPQLFFHAASSPAAVVQQLAAAAAGASERLQLAAAEAAAATALHAACGGGDDGVVALRRALLFLLHSGEPAPAPGLASAALSQQQPRRPQPSGVFLCVAAATAFRTVLQLLQHGGDAAAAALHSAHFWLLQLCASLGGRRRRDAERFAAADKVAGQLATAVVLGEVAALLAAASSQQRQSGSGRAVSYLPGSLGMQDPVVEAVAAAAAAQAGAWHCLPAVWRALAESCEAGSGGGEAGQRASALLLGAAAALAAGGAGSSLGSGAGAVAGLPAPAGFAAPGLRSALATDIEAAQQPVPAQALAGLAMADPSAASPAAVRISRGPAFLAEQLQQSAAEHLALLTLRCRGGLAGAAGGQPAVHWAADPACWPAQLAEALARLVAGSGLAQEAAAEFLMAATRQGSAPAAASVLAQLRPEAAPLLQPLLIRLQGRLPDARQVLPGSGAAANPFVRQRQAAVGGRGAARAAAEVIDLTSSPPRQPPQQPQQQQEQPHRRLDAAASSQPPADAPWFLKWPSSKQPPQQPDSSAPAQQQRQTSQGRQRPVPQPQQQAEGTIDVESLWPSQWPDKTAPAGQQQQQQPQQQQRPREQPRSRAGPSALPTARAAVPSTARPQEERAGPAQSARQQPTAAQNAPVRQQAGSMEAEIDVDQLWPATWPARRPAGAGALAPLRAAGRAAAPAVVPRTAGRALTRGSSRSASPDAGAHRRQPATCSNRRSSGSPERPGAGQQQQQARSRQAAAPFRIPKREVTEVQRQLRPPSITAATVAANGGVAPPRTVVAPTPRQAAGQQHGGAGEAGAAAMHNSLRLLEDEQEEQLLLGEPGTALVRPQQPAPARRTIVRLASPPSGAGRRSGLRAAPVPLWQQRRAALGAARQQAAVAASLLTMDAVLQRVLSWDPASLLSGAGTLVEATPRAALRFASLQQYTQVFSALLLEELRAHLVQAVDENPAAGALCSSAAVGSVAAESVSAALASSSAVPLRLVEVQRQSELHVVRLEPATVDGTHAAPAAGHGTMQHPPGSAAEFSRSSGIRAEDLVLLVSRPSGPRAGTASMAIASAGVAVALAAVESVHMTQPSERRQQPGTSSHRKQLLLTMRVSLHGTSSGGSSSNRQLLQQQLTAGTSWKAVRLASLVPHFRQLQALVAAQRLPPLLLAELLSPRTTAPTATGSSGSGGRRTSQAQLSALQPPLPPTMLPALRQQFNGSQQAAIAAAAAGYMAGTAPEQASGLAGAAASVAEPAVPRGSQQIVLVQGPPGTGKTAAVMGMLSAFLAPNTPPRPDGEAPAGSYKARPAVVNPTARVLLCAQSNAAVDELCARLAGKGVVGRDGTLRQTSVVRFGPLEAVSPEAATYHIDALAAGLQAADAGLGDASGQCSQLAAKLQSLRQQLHALQAQIDACDETLEASRERKRRRLARAAAGRLRGGTKRQRHDGSGSEMDTGSESGSDSGSRSDAGDGDEEAAAAQAAAALEPSSQEVRQQLGPLLQRKQQLKREVAAAASALRASSTAAAARRKELRAAVVAQSEVVASTLSSAGGELLQLVPRAGGGGCAPAAAGAPLLGFDAVICDEAAQALEPSTLIALQLLAPGGRVVLVGDPRQLPATVVSRGAAAGCLAQSLFERLQKAGYPVCMLRQQYRMHPAISAFPSAFFYEGQLLDAAAVAAGGGRAAPWHACRRLPPLAFWDCREGRESGSGGGSSVSNAEEAEVAYALYAGLAERYGRDVGDVVVLTPYRAQLAVLRRMWRARGGGAAAEAVQFATVDGFQGREADVVIFTCVRARGPHAAGGVGFLADVRRMNVALTRARRSLWVIGHSATLAGCQPWQEFMAHCSAAGCLFVAAPPYERLSEEGGGRRLRGPSPERRRQRSAG